MCDVNLYSKFLISFLTLNHLNVNVYFVVCMDGYYGNNCNTECGSCLNMEVCDKQNGTCYHGCKDHYKEPKCDGN